MERRYQLMADRSVRNISGFNQMVEKNASGEQPERKI